MWRIPNTSVNKWCKDSTFELCICFSDYGVKYILFIGQIIDILYKRKTLLTVFQDVNELDKKFSKIYKQISYFKINKVLFSMMLFGVFIAAYSAISQLHLQNFEAFIIVISFFDYIFAYTLTKSYIIAIIAFFSILKEKYAILNVYISNWKDDPINLIEKLENLEKLHLELYKVTNKACCAFGASILGNIVLTYESTLLFAMTFVNINSSSRERMLVFFLADIINILVLGFFVDALKKEVRNHGHQENFKLLH